MSEERRDQDVPWGLPDTGEVRRSPVEGGGGGRGSRLRQLDAALAQRFRDSAARDSATEMLESGVTIAAMDRKSRRPSSFPLAASRRRWASVSRSRSSSA
jgi:hypothetical protein